MKEFGATLDKKTKTMTFLGIAMFAFILFSFLPQLQKGERGGELGFYLTLALFLVAFLLPYLFHPVKYVLTEDELIIKRVIKPYVIKIREIKQIRPVSKDELRGTLRVFGSGGVFGYFGKFRNKNFGTMIFFTTRTDNRVYILTADGKNIIVSPDNVEEFVETVNKRIEKIG